MHFSGIGATMEADRENMVLTSGCLTERRDPDSFARFSAASNRRRIFQAQGTITLVRFACCCITETGFGRTSIGRLLTDALFSRYFDANRTC